MSDKSGKRKRYISQAENHQAHPSLAQRELYNRRLTLENDYDYERLNIYYKEMLTLAKYMAKDGLKVTCYYEEPIASGLK